MAKCIEDCGKGENLPFETESSLALGYSRKFQWLPCDVELGNPPKIASYINNLHPYKHTELYGLIERVIDKAIPLWNLTLTPVKNNELSRPRIRYESAESEIPSHLEEQRPVPEAGQIDDDFPNREERWERSVRVYPQPEPTEFSRWTGKKQGDKFISGGTELKGEHKVDLKRDQSESGLQIIVKLANIELTPDKPEYKGGSWHLEGQLNEHICATAIYYYSMDNITSSRLAFRQQSTTEGTFDIGYEQDQHEWLSTIFGCEQDGPATQEIGAITAMQGRLVTFPNIVQHCVQPFRLADPNRPGHRKILALFLVDPSVTVISTSHVPCQQASWWAESLRMDKNKLEEVPPEVYKMIIDGVEDFPISLEDAKKLRLELMAERTNWGQEQNAKFEEETFSLCEH